MVEQCCPCSSDPKTYHTIVIGIITKLPFKSGCTLKWQLSLLSTVVKVEVAEDKSDFRSKRETTLPVVAAYVQTYQYTSMEQNSHGSLPHFLSNKAVRTIPLQSGFLPLARSGSRLRHYAFRGLIDLHAALANQQFWMPLCHSVGGEGALIIPLELVAWTRTSTCLIFPNFRVESLCWIKMHLCINMLW